MKKKEVTYETDSTTRVTIRVSKKVKEYFEQRSQETGVAQSALMLLAMEEYIDQKKIIGMNESNDNTEGMKELLTKVVKESLGFNMGWEKDIPKLFEGEQMSIDDIKNKK